MFCFSILRVHATGLACTLSIMLAFQTAAANQSPSSERLMMLIQAQQEQLDALKAELKNATEAAAANTKEDASSTAKMRRFLDSIKIGGVIEVEATNTETYAGADSSDISLAKVELFLDTQPHALLATHMQLLYEDDGNENITLDEAFATLGSTDKFPLYVQAGKWVIPFGGFETAMNTDPLTKNLGETKEAAILAGFAKGGFSISGYAYNGDTQKSGEGDNIDQFGVSMEYGGEFGGTSVSFGGGYIGNIADSDGLSDALGSNTTALANYVGGWELHGSVGVGPVTVYGGYMSAADSFKSDEVAFNGQGAQPTAWNAEAAYSTEVMGKEVIIAVTVQGTEEALAVSLPEMRFAGALTFQAMEHTAVIVEYIHDEDYDTGDGGTGNNGHTVTLKLAVDF